MADESAATRRPVLRVLVMVVIVLLAFFAGMLVERVRFDFRRDDMLRRYDEALRQHREQIMQSEKQSEKTLTR